MAAKATQIDFLLAGLVDTNGDFLSGGKVYTYDAGTTTPRDTWTDSDMTTVAANPIILDAYGRAQIFASGLYKFEVYDANDNLFYTWDYINYGMHNPYVTDFSNAAHDHSSTAMGGDLGILNDVKTKGPWADVRAYGAVGDGTTDDSEAFYQALQSGKNVYIPTGDYYIGTDGKLLISTFGQLIQGDGMQISKIKLGTGINGFRADPNLTYYDIHESRFVLSDLMIYGSGSGKGFYSDSTVQLYQTQFKNLVIQTGDVAIHIEKGFSYSLDNIHFSSETGHGVDLACGNTVTLYNCYAKDIGPHGSPTSGKAGYKIVGQATLINCNGVNTAEYWGIFGDSSTSSMGRVALIGCNIEDFKLSGLKIEYAAHQIDMTNCVMIAPSTTLYNTSTFNYYIETDTESDKTQKLTHVLLWSNGTTTSEVADFYGFYPIQEGDKDVNQYTCTNDGINTFNVTQLYRQLSSAFRGTVYENIKIGYLEEYSLGGKVNTFGTAAPTSGDWVTGDIVWNLAPAAGGNIGWVCVASGTPGTWKTFGTIAT